ncbi:MAG: hypothetical protein WA823_00215 [Candidatus Acidiferrales bacterium]
MRKISIVGTAALLLFLAGGAAAYAQDGHEEPKSEPAAKPEAKPQAKPESKPESKPATHTAPKPVHHSETAKTEPKTSEAEPETKHVSKPATEETRKTEENRKEEETRSASNSHPTPSSNSRNSHPATRTETRTTQETHNKEVSRNETVEHGRIPDDRYREHFGREHTFHVGHPELVGGHGRFEYGGYSFTFAQPWPTVWGYGDPVYIVDINGVYYLMDELHPGIQLALVVVV